MDIIPKPLPALAELESLSVTELKMHYERLLQTRAPARASADFLRGNIAWSLQAEKMSKDPASLRQRLLERSRKRPPKSQSTYKSGTRLVREWRGTTFEVTVTDQGYVWRNQCYRSLSEIARRITGSHCSGPRFFGLK